MEKIKNLILKIWVTVRVEGPLTFFEKSLRRIKRVKKYTYQDWIRDFEQKDFSKEKPLLKFQPKFILLIFVSEAKTEAVNQTFKSIKQQLYPNFETISLKDVKTRALTWKDLLKTIQGDYIVPIKAGDQLSPTALFEIAKLLNTQDLDLIYSDEDFLDTSGKRESPAFKPDYSPEFLESTNYIGNLVAVKKETLGKTFLRDSSVKWSNYELPLAVKEVSRAFGHIPEVLYHNPKSKESPSNEIEILGQHLKRLGREVEVKETSFLGVFETREKLKADSKATIIILCGGHWDYLKRCLESIYRKTSYKNFEVMAVDNSVDASFETKIKSNFREVIYRKDWEKPFNFSKLYNQAVKNIKTDFVLLLNDDTISFNIFNSLIVQL